MAVEICESNQLAKRAAEHIAEALKKALSVNSTAYLCLAGGTTPRVAYEDLAKIPGIDWSKVSVYFGDERAVPPTDPDSNFAMAKAALFDRVPLPATNIHRITAEDPDQDAAARAYEALLPARISVMVLGIGEDGHTASLFPGSPALNERTRRVLPVIGPKPPPRRLSVTPPVIEAAELCIVIANGAGKAEPVRRALKDPLDVQTPPSALARSGLWLLDPAAAALLS